MSATYEKAPEGMRELADELIAKYHMELQVAKVKLDFIFAHPRLDQNGDPVGPAISHNGYQAAGQARILSLKDRAMDRGDGEILIDGSLWPRLNEEQQRALLDHELTHFQIKKDKYGAFQYDDLERPRLKMKKHDRQFGWFDSIARRYGTNSFEVRQFQDIYIQAEQTYFPFVTSEHVLKRAHQAE